MSRQTHAAVGKFKILPAHHTITSDKPPCPAAWNLVKVRFTTISKSHRHCTADTSADNKTMAKSRNKTKIEDSRTPCLARNKEQSLAMSMSPCHLLCPFVSLLYRLATILAQ